MSIEIIAEAGINHQGDIKIAMEMVKQAKKVGADTIKFQLVDPNFYEVGSELYNIFKQTFLQPSDHFKLKRYAEKLGIKYLCTPSDEKMAHTLVEAVGVDRIKVASDSANNTNLIRYIEENKIPYLISTGHIGSAKEVIKWSKNISPVLATILHCVSKYPCPEEELGIKNIQTLCSSLPHKIGFSDHSVGVSGAFLAVGAGARVIEKHFKIDEKGVDAPLSLNPNDFKRMVQLIREAEKML